MKKEKLVMVSSKVLNQMLAYRRYNKYYASYREACESIKTEIDKFRKDSFRVTLMQSNTSTSPSIFIRSFQNILVSIASKCLLTAAECSGEHKLYNEIFDSMFEVMGEMMNDYSEKDNQDLDHYIFDKFADFEASVSGNYPNTVLLYQIAVNCIFLYNYVDAKANKHQEGEKILVTVSHSGIKLNNKIFFDVRLKDYLHKEVFVKIEKPESIISVYNESDVFVCNAIEINSMTLVEVGGGK